MLVVYLLCLEGYVWAVHPYSPSSPYPTYLPLKIHPQRIVLSADTVKLHQNLQIWTRCIPKIFWRQSPQTVTLWRASHADITPT